MKKITLLICLLFCTAEIHAHDFWLEAKPFYSKPGTKVDISLYVGENMFGETLPNIPDNYSDFSYTSKHGRKNLSGDLGRDPAGYFKTNHPAYYTIGYRNHTNEVSLNAEKFTLYLKKEGLDKIIAFRAANKQSDQDVRELYSRCVKTIVKMGNENLSDYSRQEFGYTLEIIPDQNPYQVQLGDTLSVTVKYLGRPLENTLIMAFTKENPKDLQQNRTDTDGKASIIIDKPGTWLIKTVEMVPSAEQNINWESFWSSLTFQR